MSAPAFSRAFARAKAVAIKEAAYTVEVPSELWADGRPSKPTSPVSIGLRKLSEDQLQRAEIVAGKHAWREFDQVSDHEQRLDCYNRYLLVLLMADAAVRPENGNEPFFGQNVADIKIAKDLTREGIAFLFDHYEIFVLRDSPIAQEASDEELFKLGESLSDGSIFDDCDIEQARHFRRLIAAALRALTTDP